MPYPWRTRGDRGSGDLGPTAYRGAVTLDLRLVVTDMDGTLLGPHGEVPEDLWPLLDLMNERGIVFSPASGRQYATLRRTFHQVSDGMVFIAENGAYVVRDGQELSSHPIDGAHARTVVQHLRHVAGEGLDLGVVLCGRDRAYVERTDRDFLDHVDPYYASLEEVPDLLAVEDVAVKVAVWTSADPESSTAPALARFTEDVQVVVSGPRWVDVMPLGVDKGVAVAELQRALGVAPSQTVVFGDMPNDLAMIDAAHHSFAMADGHPDVLARARHRAPSHRDNGVTAVLRDLLGRSGPAAPPPCSTASSV
jgi:Cof subfamily protein (haloacid dehalogenase superfamily)